MNAQKKRKWVPLVGIIFGIVMCYVIPFFLLFDQTNKAGSLRDIVSVFTCITAGITALFTGINIMLTVEQHGKDMQVAIFSRWYNELILDRHLEKIRDFYSTCETLISCFERLNEERGQMTGDDYDKLVQEKVANPFTHKFTSMRKGLVNDLRIMDRDLSVRVSEILQQLQDDFFKGVETTHDPQRIQKIISDSHNSVMKQLVDFNKDIMKTSKLSAWIIE